MVNPDDPTRPDPPLPRLAHVDLGAASRAIMEQVRLPRRPMAEATKRKIAAAMRARGPHSEAMRAKISQATKRALAARPAYALPREFTKAHRAALSKAAKARGPMSYVTRAKIQQTLKGRALAESTKAKIRASKADQPRANKDRPAPPLDPVNQRRRDSAKAAWVLRRLEKQHGGRIPAWLADDPQVVAAYDTLNTQRSLRKDDDDVD